MSDQAGLSNVMVLVATGESREVCHWQSDATEEDIRETIEKKFNVENTIVQLYDETCGQFINIHNLREIPNKAKLKLLVKPETLSDKHLDTHNSETTHHESSQSCEAETEVNGRWSFKQFPLHYVCPVTKFSPLLSQKLKKKEELTWTQKKELKDVLVNDMSQFTIRPTKSQRVQVCRTLIELYPHLKESEGSGYEARQISLKDGFRFLRQQLGEEGQVKRAKKRSFSQIESEGRDDAPEDVARDGLRGKKPRNGTVNSHPDLPVGEDTESIGRHIDFMKKNYKKKDADILKAMDSKMNVTFPSRRELINAEGNVDKICQTYPYLFTERQIAAEYKRLMSIDLKENFNEKCMFWAPMIIDYARTRKQLKEAQTLLKNFDSRIKTADQSTTNDAMATTATMLLPLLLRDEQTDLVTVCEPGISKDDIEALASRAIPQPHIYIVPDIFNPEADIYIAAEGRIIMDTISSIPMAVMFVHAIIFIFNIQYSKSLQGTMDFIEHKIMSIASQREPMSKVNTLCRNVMKFKQN